MTTATRHEEGPGCLAQIAELRAARDAAERSAVEAHAVATTLRNELADAKEAADFNLCCTAKIQGELREDERKLAVAIEALKSLPARILAIPTESITYQVHEVASAALQSAAACAEDALATINPDDAKQVDNGPSVTGGAPGEAASKSERSDLADGPASKPGLVIGQRYRLGDLPVGSVFEMNALRSSPISKQHMCDTLTDSGGRFSPNNIVVLVSPPATPPSKAEPERPSDGQCLALASGMEEMGEPEGADVVRRLLAHTKLLEQRHAMINRAYCGAVERAKDWEDRYETSHRNRTHAEAALGAAEKRERARIVAWLRAHYSAGRIGPMAAKDIERGEHLRDDHTTPGKEGKL